MVSNSIEMKIGLVRTLFLGNEMMVGAVFHLFALIDAV